ncbi:DsbA family protein [Vibrio owensii]|uniref:DsbA family protein n=1 Tax=Vibrio owensii TaxID=696485 RepID=UPI00406855E9
MKWLPIASTLIVCSLSLPANANQSVEFDQDKFNAMLLTALKENPEILREGFISLQALSKKEEEKKQIELLNQQSEAIFSNSSDPVLNALGTVPVAEFFDYRCGACKKVSNDMKTLVTEDNRVRMIYKDVAILGPESEKLAKISIAVGIANPNSYPAFHYGLMSMRSPNEDYAYRLAKQLELNVEEIQTLAAGKQVATKLAENNRLFMTLKLKGTPSIYIGDTLIPGVVGLNTLKAKVDAAEKELLAKAN